MNQVTVAGRQVQDDPCKALSIQLCTLNARELTAPSLQVVSALCPAFSSGRTPLGNPHGNPFSCKWRHCSHFTDDDTVAESLSHSPKTMGMETQAGLISSSVSGFNRFCACYHLLP